MAIFTNALNQHVPGNSADTGNEAERLVLDEVKH